LANDVSQLRPNPARSVEVFGDFNDDLASRLASEVSRLKAENSTQSITVYINSLGGGIRELEIIDGILRSSDLDGNSCLYLTVAIGNAASAAANLLTFGFYAYAHEHSLIYFHGARRTDILEAAAEDATQLANELQRLNLRISRKLAKAVISRMVYMYQALWPEFKDMKIGKEVPGEFALLNRYLNFVGKNLSPIAKRLVSATYRQMESASRLSENILPSVIPKMGKRINPAADDAKVLIGVVKHELKINRGKASWRLDERGVNQVVNDYHLLRDYNLGEHTAVIDQLIRSFGVGFLSEEEFVEYETLKSDRKKTFALLMKSAGPHLLPLWYFSVSMCRLLMHGENRLTPIDAYYLGIVDEIIGTKMTGRRIVDEQIEQAKEKDSPETVNPATA